MSHRLFAAGRGRSSGALALRSPARMAAWRGWEICCFCGGGGGVYSVVDIFFIGVGVGRCWEV